MAVEDPQKGSFRIYSKKAFGNWAGFSHGWTYWCSELLIMGSQLSALGIFSRYWFPKIPLWIFATIYGVAAILIIFIGVKIFERLEKWMAIIKIAAIMGLMTIRLKDPKDAQKSGRVMLMILTIIYVVSLGLAIMMVPLNQFNTKESPFVIALQDYNLPYVSFILNVVLILAGFSTLVGSLFAVTSVLMNLAEEGDAPAMFAKKNKKNISFPALTLIIIGLGASILSALLLPKNIYEYVTTAAGLMLLYTWSLILLSFWRLMNPKGWMQIKSIIGLIMIALAVSGTLLQKTTRFGFLVSLLFLGIVIIVTIIVHFVSRKRNKAI